MRISLATSVYANFPIEEAIRRIAAAGYDGVDLWGGRPHVYRRDLTSRQLTALRRLIRECGLEAPSLTPAFFRYPHSLTSPNEAVRQDSLDYTRQCADHAAALGAGLLLLVPGRSLHGQPIEDAWQRLADSLSAICAYAAQYALRLAVEPVNSAISDLVNTAAEAVRLLEQVGCDRLGIVLDTGHVHLGPEPPEEAIARAGARLFQVHVNDNDGRRQQNLIPGLGRFDFDRFFRSLERAGYSGWLTAELDWRYTQDPDPAARQAAAPLRAML